jgi:hypothetical protein
VEVEATLRLTVGQSVSQSVCLGVGHPFGAHDQLLLFPFFCRKVALFFVLGRPLWRKEWSVICSVICQWLDSRRTHNHTLLSHLRLLGSLSVASYDSQGLRWKYSFHRPAFYLKLSSLYVPHKKHIASPLPAQQVNAFCRFVKMVYWHNSRNSARYPSSSLLFKRQQLGDRILSPSSMSLLSWDHRQS